MPFTELEIKQIVDKQRKFFRSGATLDVKWRIAQLRKLRDAVAAHEEEFEDALHKDLGRSRTEAYLCDVGPFIVEINEMLCGLRRWARPERQAPNPPPARRFWRQRQLPVRANHHLSGGQGRAHREQGTFLPAAACRPLQGRGSRRNPGHHRREGTPPRDVPFHEGYREHPYNGDRLLPVLRLFEK